VLYHDNLNLAIEQCGMVCNELIPVVYDAPRIVKVLGVDGKQDMQAINDTGNPDSIDIGMGKYSVTVATGPSFMTKRMEAAEDMRSLANAAPQLLSLFADLYVEAQDWPMAEEIARRIRTTLPPGLVDPKDMTPELQQQHQAAAQQQQQQMAMQVRMAVAEYMKTQSETALNSARAQHFAVQAELAPAKTQNESLTAASTAAERELKGHLDAIRVADGH